MKPKKQSLLAEEKLRFFFRKLEKKYVDFGKEKYFMGENSL
jgi:hypothetical protein